jgi:predicted alpha-1,2-mannosidase
MVGDPADSIIADAYAFGATNFDASQALSDMETQAEVPGNIRPGLSYYESDGYLPIDGTYGCCNFYGPVSTQQEYDIADNSIAELANDLGKGTLAQTFAVRAQNWQNVFNPDTGFMQPKEGAGMFQPGFSPTSENGFVEADSYVYTALVPFDLAGLVAAEGGNAAWVDFLNGLTSDVTTEGPTQIQMGNEPSFEIPWEYDYAGAPSQTQQVVREIQDQLYTDSPTGLAGNDDLGAMSSWYVWSALGAYPETPGSAEVALGSPLFPAITLTLANGRTITETAPAASQDSPYVEGLAFDGSPWQDAYLPSSIFTEGGTLDWTLGSSPSTWASAPADAPPSSTAGLLPALGYLAGTNDGETIVTPGGTATLDFGVQSMSGASQRIRWTASAQSGSGIVIASATGTMTVKSEANGTQSIEAKVPSKLADGQYTVTLSLTTRTGVALPALVAVIDVA